MNFPCDMKWIRGSVRYVKSACVLTKEYAYVRRLRWMTFYSSLFKLSFSQMCDRNIITVYIQTVICMLTLYIILWHAELGRHIFWTSEWRIQA